MRTEDTPTSDAAEPTPAAAQADTALQEVAQGAKKGRGQGLPLQQMVWTGPQTEADISGSHSCYHNYPNYKLLEEHLRENLCDLRLSKDFLEVTPKSHL